MGFDASSPIVVRDKNYHESEVRHQSQKERILQAMNFGTLKVASPSMLYNYFNETNGGEELYPLTSIRARMTEMSKTTNKGTAKIVFVREDKSELYNSTEAYYTLIKTQGGLF